jgi:uncharacterized protein
MDYHKIGERFFLRLYKDEDLFESLQDFAVKEELQSGQLSGIGALKETEIGFYHLDKKEYAKKVFSNEAELISLQGNLSSLEGRPFFHIHGVLGQSDYSTVGGHFFSAKVAVTVELFFTHFPANIPRLHDEEIGLNLLSFCSQ